MINIYQPSLGEEEVSAVREVFQSNWLGYGRNGTKQDEFVNKFDEVHDNSEDYIYEYISSTGWNDNNPEEVYFKITKRQVSYDN